MWLGNFTLVLPNEVVNSGSVRVEDGVIAEIRPEPVAGAVIDGGGRLLMPGFVDLHGDMIEREIAPRPVSPRPMRLFPSPPKASTAMSARWKRPRPSSRVSTGCATTC